ncbi:MAG TPA: hypothetical protein VEU06_11595 [Micropepsaceae bacterium]|nr:hypothetical protein [Micropepsaceae bacterium]
MRGRAVAAALVVCTGLWSVSTAAAATTDGVGPLRLGTAQTAVQDPAPIVNFSLGSVSLTPFASANATSGGFSFEFARGRNWDIYGDLFPGATALRSSYMLGSSSLSGMRMTLGDSLSVGITYDALSLGALDPNQPSAFSRELAARLGSDVRSIGTTAALMNWNFSDWGALGLSALRSTGNSSLLGITSGALAGLPTDTTALGISARVGFGEGWVTTVAYNEGVTQLDLNRNLIPAGDSVRSQAYGISFAKQGLFGGDALGIAVSRPLEVYAGLSPASPNFALQSSPVRESDVELGYVTTFLDGTLALQANAAYQLNAAGARGQNAVAGVARAKLNF